HYAKEALGLAARIGKSSGYGGVAENIDQPQYATAVGLMLTDVHNDGTIQSHHAKSGGKSAVKSASGFISKFLDRFKV
ncbi:MAG TPA: hypothetical protein VFM68_00680, partial [Candidatus Saccharimonadales bacterium]|nr:hypothetical protein [Candidatus Saccharimonadales bacterium]